MSQTVGEPQVGRERETQIGNFDFIGIFLRLTSSIAYFHRHELTFNRSESNSHYIREKAKKKQHTHAF